MNPTDNNDLGFPDGVAEMSIDQLMAAIDRRVAAQAGENPWPTIAGRHLHPFPWPSPVAFPPVSPYSAPPVCPACGGALFPGGCSAAHPMGGAARRASVGAPNPAVSFRRILEELIAALKAWKVRFATVRKDSRLSDMVSTGNGRFDILSAVARWRFFQDLGLALAYVHIGADETVSDVAETIARLLEDAGHGVTP